MKSKCVVYQSLNGIITCMSDKCLSVKLCSSLRDQNNFLISTRLKYQKKIITLAVKQCQDILLVLHACVYRKMQSSYTKIFQISYIFQRLVGVNSFIELDVNISQFTQEIVHKDGFSASLDEVVQTDRQTDGGESKGSSCGRILMASPKTQVSMRQSIENNSGLDNSESWRSQISW